MNASAQLNEASPERVVPIVGRRWSGSKPNHQHVESANDTGEPDDKDSLDLG